MKNIEVHPSIIIALGVLLYQPIVIFGWSIITSLLSIGGFLLILIGIVNLIRLHNKKRIEKTKN